MAELPGGRDHQGDRDDDAREPTGAPRPAGRTGEPDATVVRLEASQAVREERIRSREFGALRDLFLEKTGDIEDKMRRFGIGDVVLENEKEPQRVASRLLEEIGWDL